MAAEKIRAHKRKSTDSAEQALKRVKVAKSADRPLPRKSALKGSKVTPAPAPATDKINAEDLDFEDDQEEDDVDASELTADQTAALLAGFSSSDEDEDEQDDGIALDTLPNPPKSALSISSATLETTAANDDPERMPGVVYIGRLPHGFYEKQMQAYFSQFGDITHLRVARNKKTGRSKHHAFVEFASSAVADIVCKTMDKYLLFNHILRVQRIPKEHVKEGIWRGEGRGHKAPPRNKMEGARLQRGTDIKGWTRRVGKENKRRVATANKLKELGYEFSMPVLKDVPDPVLDTPTLEREAEQQLLDEIEQAADAQSDEVALQPEMMVQSVDEMKSSKPPGSKASSKRTKSKK